MNIKLRNLGIRFAFCGVLVISSLYMVWPDPITATAQVEKPENLANAPAPGIDTAAASSDTPDITRVSTTAAKLQPRQIIN